MWMSCGPLRAGDGSVDLDGFVAATKEVALSIERGMRVCTEVIVVRPTGMVKSAERVVFSPGFREVGQTKRRWFAGGVSSGEVLILMVFFGGRKARVGV